MGNYQKKREPEFEQFNPIVMSDSDLVVSILPDWLKKEIEVVRLAARIGIHPEDKKGLLKIFEQRDLSFEEGLSPDIFKI